MDPFVFIATPTAAGKTDCRWEARLAKSRAKYKTMFGTTSGSAQMRNFNRLYAGALNARAQGITHFLMLHDDVLPQDGDVPWMQTMFDLMHAYSLKALSAIVAIKDARRTVSCGLRDANGGNKNFTIEEFGPPGTTRVNGDGGVLLVNTGCLLIDIREPWAEQLHFEMADTIYKDKDGQFKAHFEPEDYRMSVRLSEMGVRYGATNAVKTFHVGTYDWPNH